MLQDGQRWRVICGDAYDTLRMLPDSSVHCCVTSPPYFALRDYGCDGQIGLEATPELYIARLVELFDEVRRVLRDDGTLWVNIGDSYNAYNGNRGTSPSLDRERDTAAACRPRLPTGTGLTTPDLKPKDLLGVPWMLAFALRADRWYLRSDVIWHKPNPMPESVTDRPTKSHEYLFLLSKSSTYYYDAQAIAEPAIDWGKRDRTNGKYHNEGSGLSPHRGLTGRNHTVELMGQQTETRNKRSVWTVSTKPYKGAHFACYPPELIQPCILAGCPVDGLVLDPFAGCGTTGQVAVELGRRAVMIELNPKYIKLIERRMAKAQPPLPGIEPGS